MDKLSSLIQKISLLKNLLVPQESRTFTKEEIEGLMNIKIQLPSMEKFALLLKETKGEDSKNLEELKEHLALIVENVENNRSWFESQDLSGLWDEDKRYLTDVIIHKQSTLSDEVYGDLCEAKQELNDAVSNKLSDEIIAKLQRRVNLLETANDLENDKLDELLIEYQYLEKKAKNANIVFSEIADKCRNFLYIITHQPQSTIQKTDNSLNDSVDIKDRNQPFFPMDLIGSIYNLCNGKQFEEVKELEFYKFWNFQENKDLKIKKGEKARVCYLIYLLAESLVALQRAEWKKNILNRLGISKEIYHSKYKDPVSDLPSRANREFADALKEIFQKNN